MSPDRHALYLRAVQTPEIDVAFVDRIFRARFGRTPMTLREDFCGSAAVCASWVESEDDREALGVDLDREVIEWSSANVLAALDEDERSRIALARRDVRERSDRSFDAICALNFSWAILEDPAPYFASARACLEDEGLLVLELFGGSDLERTLEDEHERYVWEHRTFDESQRRLSAAIHLRTDAGLLRDAFTYVFHLRAHDELVAMLLGAGFASVELHVEISPARFRKIARPPRTARYTGYLVALTAPDRGRAGRRGGRARSRSLPRR